MRSDEWRWSEGRTALHCGPSVMIRESVTNKRAKRRFHDNREIANPESLRFQRGIASRKSSSMHKVWKVYSRFHLQSIKCLNIFQLEVGQAYELM